MLRCWFLFALLIPASFAQPKPVRLAIAGLNHGHVSGFLSNAARRAGDIEIVAVYDPSPALLAKYAKSNGFADNLLFTDLARMLDTVRPEAVAAFSDTASHLMVVQACAPRHIPVMMEKPLAVDVNQAREIQQLADRYQVPVIVNFETTWYPANPELWTLTHDQKAGEIRRMVAETGHSGPKEINVQPEFLEWLTDPARAGGGALFDFGCYGANLMTWLMDGKAPLKVTALTQSSKPDIYARVDDEATILLEYPKAQGVIQASWNWPFDRKDFEVYYQRGTAIATSRGTNLTVRLPGMKTEEAHKPADRIPEEHDAISYFTAVVRGKIKPDGPSSLAINVVVVEILDAARESARTGRAVSLGEPRRVQ